LEVLVEESTSRESISIETAVPEDILTLRSVKDRLPSLRTVSGRHLSDDLLDIFEHAPSLQEAVLVKHFNWKLKWSPLRTLKHDLGAQNSVSFYRRRMSKHWS